MAHRQVAHSRIVFVVWGNHNMRKWLKALCRQASPFVAMQSAQAKARPTSIYTAFNMSLSTLNELHPRPTISESSDKTVSNENNTKYIDPSELNTYVSAKSYTFRDQALADSVA